MVGVDQRSEPADVIDPMLWRDAQELLSRHTEPDHTGLCVECGRSWPCVPRRCAERAAAASRRPWNESWTARHDLRTVPLPRPGGAGRHRAGSHRTGGNRGVH